MFVQFFNYFPLLNSWVFFDAFKYLILSGFALKKPISLQPINLVENAVFLNH